MRGLSNKRSLTSAVVGWVRRQPPKVKAFLAVVSGMSALVLLRFVVHDHDNLFVAAETCHAIGICVLIYKLTKERTCAGTIIITTIIIIIINAARRAAPCAILALVVHPSTSHNILNRILWAFCVYLEAVSVLPQLRVMQNTKIVEPFTAHYVFALGVARFLSCAHWVLQVLDTRGQLLTALGYGLWPSMVLLSEIVQTFILADFCYYYIKSVVGGQLVLRIPSGVV
ncbi:uncharacterized protein LOC131237352 isoform X5 [Magnolia sinica]|uniref:uncharacterized protein LOC131237352 isoform X5 n=1 Tax=Magnolia sinica TaxID=86752 RepID=UPI0026590334|nr:uncharacterized protein LOC131237352 isoform X5 [Magnolia sinica]